MIGWMGLWLWQILPLVCGVAAQQGSRPSHDSAIYFACLCLLATWRSREKATELGERRGGKAHCVIFVCIWWQRNDCIFGTFYWSLCHWQCYSHLLFRKTYNYNSARRRASSVLCLSSSESLALLPRNRRAPCFSLAAADDVCNFSPPDLSFAWAFWRGWAAASLWYALLP